MEHPTSRPRKITTTIFVVFTLVMNPPIIFWMDLPTIVFGTDLLYLWTVCWGVLISIVLIWAAWNDALALTEDQVPPELRGTEGVVTQSRRGETATEGQS